MSFSVHNPASGTEYNGHSLTSLFAQRRNLLKPAFWGLLSEIVRFNRLAKLALTEALDRARRWSFLTRHRFSPFFARHYILPMGAAIWSSSLQEMRRFRCRCFCASLKTTVCWIFAIARNGTWCPAVPGNTSAPCSPGSAIVWIYASTRRCSRWTATRRGHPAAGVREAHFDQVIFACHSAQAGVLAAPTDSEREVLGDIGWQRNEVVLHSDPRWLPERQRARASWNYRLSDGDRAGPASPTT